MSPRELSGYVSDLLSLGSSYGAIVSAGTAIDALVSVDNVLAILLGDSLNGAGISASAAADALVKINLVSHFSYLQ